MRVKAKKQPKILVIGDTHFPAADQRVLEAIYKEAQEMKPDYIVQLGDLYDFFCFSKFARSLNWMTPEEEINLGREQAEEFWKRLQKAAPKAQCYQLLGNHDQRLLKRVLDKVPELESIMSAQKELFNFSKVTSMKDATSELILGDILFIHGYKSGLGAHMRRNGKKTVVGHSHLGGVVNEKFLGSVLWEANAGYTGDPSQPVFKYGSQDTDKWTRGYLTIDEKGPKFICLEDQLYKGK
jgi:predicted MPP superfamily phosphohydrolase